MTMGELNLNDVDTFVCIVDLGSLSGAATRLSLSKSSVSRCLSRFEDHLGVRLLQRTSRSIALTDAGRAYYQRVAGDLNAILDASKEAGASNVSGVVRFSAPYDFGAEALPGGMGATTGGGASSDAASSHGEGDGGDGAGTAATASTEGGDSTGEGGELPMPLDRLRVIFSGHSLTNVAVPTIRAIAQNQGDDLRDIYQSIPGSPIRVRTRGGNPAGENSWGGYAEGTNGVNLIDEIRSPTLLPAGEVYDTLVITDRHDLLGVVQY